MIHSPDIGFLPHLPENSPLSIAFGVSADGLVIVGTAGSATAPMHAFRWTQAAGMTSLGDLPLGSSSSGARAASVDGSVIVGYGNSAFGQEARRWTPASGMVGLGDLPGGDCSSIAHGVAADGMVVVGSGTSGDGQEAFLWDAVHGMRSLKSVLTVAGRDLAGWTLTSARDISADGLTIVGTGINPLGQAEGWRVSLVPEPSTWILLALGLGLVGWRCDPAWRNRSRGYGFL